MATVVAPSELLSFEAQPSTASCLRAARKQRCRTAKLTGESKLQSAYTRVLHLEALVQQLQNAIDADPELATRLALIAPVVRAGIQGVIANTVDVVKRNVAAHHFTIPASVISSMDSKQLNRVQRAGRLASTLSTPDNKLLAEKVESVMASEGCDVSYFPMHGTLQDDCLQTNTAVVSQPKIFDPHGDDLAVDVAVIVKKVYTVPEPPPLQKPTVARLSDDVKGDGVEDKREDDAKAEQLSMVRFGPTTTVGPLNPSVTNPYAIGFGSTSARTSSSTSRSIQTPQNV